MDERGDIVRSMHRALESNGLDGRRDTSQLALHRQTLSECIVGRVIDKQLATDEFGVRVQLVIDATDGRVHQIEVGIAATEEVTRGMIVAAVPPPTAPRIVDRNIAAMTDDLGLYRPSEHLERVQAEKLAIDAERFVRMHLRRLEALRRVGIVERRDEDTWSVPDDLPDRGLVYDRQRHGRGPRMDVLSGATWLDRELVAQHPTPIRKAGFGAEVTRALERRKRLLIGFGAAVERSPGDVRLARNLVPWLEQREVERVGRALAAERGFRWRPVASGDRLQGKLVGSTRLASGALMH